MKMKKVLSTVLASAMVLTLLSGCGGGSSSGSSTTTAAATTSAATEAATEAAQTEGSAPEEGKTLSGTVEYWSSYSETENQAMVLQKAAAAFMKLHPDVKINFTFNGRDNRYLVQSALEAGTQIDMMDANIDNIKNLWAENIMDLSDYLDRVYDTTNGQPYRESVMPSMLGLASDLFGGRTMCIPYIPQAFMIFCNKEIFEEVGITEYPTTWAEFLDACAKIKAAGYIPITVDDQRKPSILYR